MQFHRPHLLDAATDRRDDFACGEPSLDEWLRRYAGQSRRTNTAAVWVISDEDHRVVCYATLSMTAIDRTAAPGTLTKGAPRQVPALLIGRLGTDRRVAGLGLATQLVAHVLATAVELNLKAVCRAVVVTALSPGAFSWWQRFGFTPFDPADPRNLDLFLLTSDITATRQAGES